MQGWLQGLKADGDANQLPTIAIVASYDTFGAAPVCNLLHITYLFKILCIRFTDPFDSVIITCRHYPLEVIAMVAALWHFLR